MTHSSRWICRLVAAAVLALSSGVGSARAQAPATPAPAAAKRPMTFLDVQKMRSIGGASVSPDGRWLLYTISTPDWKEARRQTDIYLVSLQQGLSSTKQMTFTKDKNETEPQWSHDGRFFVFASNRDAPSSSATQNQLYAMRPDGGEARKITEAKDGVSTFAFSHDGKWLAYRAGKSGEEQLYRLPADNLDAATPEALTKQAAGVGRWEWASDDKRIYFVGAVAPDADEKARRDKKFTVDIKNAETPLASLWAVDLEPRKVTALTKDDTISVGGFSISPDSKWVAFDGMAANRYKRNITEQNINADPFLLEVGTGQIERLVKNTEVSESTPRFSPDSRFIAFSASDDLENYSMKNERVYLRAVSDRGGKWRKLGASYDGDLSVGFWSKDGNTIYFNDGLRATTQCFALDVVKDAVRPLTNEKAALTVSQDHDTGVILINYSDGTTPPTLFTVPDVTSLATRSSWKALTDANPQTREWALGEQEEYSWKSKDGKLVGGVLVKPVGYQAGRRYPLIVAIHGGPAAADVLRFNGGYGAQIYADVLRFNGGYGAQIYAGAGYVVLEPNYRGSTNYGEAHKTAIVGNYFPPGFDDIMTGVDALVAQGLVDPASMGVLGWSAGGHWSNWILTHTDRFKAISSGAGTSNWISMYAESDVQRNRQFYLGNKLPYDDFDAYWVQSPLKYIKNARTPTMIHVVQGDPRVPSPQSIELHMALQRLGVPTELFLYPGQSHSIPDTRNQLVKSVAEMAWMDYYVRGMGKKFAWRSVLDTIEDESAKKAEAAGEKR
jgi:dipeptidyl aminopeptidase/acylaminoacyl peptidase